MYHESQSGGGGCHLNTEDWIQSKNTKIKFDSHRRRYQRAGKPQRNFDKIEILIPELLEKAAQKD